MRNMYTRTHSLPLFVCRSAFCAVADKMKKNLSVCVVFDACGMAISIKQWSVFHIDSMLIRYDIKCWLTLVACYESSFFGNFLSIAHCTLRSLERACARGQSFWFLLLHMLRLISIPIQFRHQLKIQESNEMFFSYELKCCRLKLSFFPSWLMHSHHNTKKFVFCCCCCQFGVSISIGKRESTFRKWQAFWVLPRKSENRGNTLLMMTMFMTRNASRKWAKVQRIQTHMCIVTV